MNRRKRQKGHLWLISLLIIMIIADDNLHIPNESDHRSGVNPTAIPI